MMNTEQQNEAIKKLSKLKVGALFMEMGTGKTKVALDLMASKQKKVGYNLWICPFSLKNEIMAEKEKWQPNLQLEIVGCESIGSSDRIYCEILEKVKNNKTFIVVDESLKIKNISAKRTKRILTFGRESEYRLILNGTPVSKNILDLWTQMEFLSPRILDMYFNQFKDTYCEYYLKGRMEGKVKTYHNIPHLISKIEPYIFEAELDISTSKNHKTYLYKTDLEDYENYKMQMFEEYFDGEDLNFNAFAMKLQRFYTRKSNRQKVIDDIIDNVNDKILIYVRFIDSIPENALKITGELNNKQRAEVIEKFKTTENVLYITYGCGAFGLNLQFCKHIIFAEHSWDYAQRVQAEARIYRIGQGSEVFYHSLYCDDVGLEDLIIKCIDKKQTLDTVIKNEICNVKGGVKEWVKSI